MSKRLQNLWRYACSKLHMYPIKQIQLVYAMIKDYHLNTLRGGGHCKAHTHTFFVRIRTSGLAFETAFMREASFAAAMI